MQNEVNKRKEQDMTYILGARCKDGIVLVGDTKVTVEGGTDFTFDKKIMVEPLNNIVMASAGSSGLYSEFQSRIRTAVRIIIEEHRIDHPSIHSEDGFKVLVTQVIRDMHNNYGKDDYVIDNNLQILCTTRIHPEARLTLFTGFGNQEPVNDSIAIGHGRYCASIFHKNMLNDCKKMIMSDVAKVGLFIICSLKVMSLDASVGFNDEFLPQIVYIPDVKLPEDFPETPMYLSEIERSKLDVRYDELTKKYPIKELDPKSVISLMDEIEPKVNKFKDIVKNIL